MRTRRNNCPKVLNAVRREQKYIKRNKDKIRFSTRSLQRMLNLGSNSTVHDLLNKDLSLEAIRLRSRQRGKEKQTE